jgi:hypothetical protein
MSADGILGRHHQKSSVSACTLPLENVYIHLHLCRLSRYERQNGRSLVEAINGMQPRERTEPWQQDGQLLLPIQVSLGGMPGFVLRALYT